MKGKAFNSSVYDSIISVMNKVIQFSLVINTVFRCPVSN
jgi:hypothetical protein